MPYEVTNAEETVGLVLEQAPTTDRTRPYVDIVDEGEEADRYIFVSKRNAFAALGEWIHRYGSVYDDSNIYNLRVFEIRRETVREEVA